MLQRIRCIVREVVATIGILLAIAASLLVGLGSWSMLFTPWTAPTVFAKATGWFSVVMLGLPFAMVITNSILDP